MTALQATLFGTCPLPGCCQPVTDPRQPCGGCQAAFGGMLQPAGTETPAEEYVRQLAERDAAVLAAQAAQHAAAHPAARRGPAVAWKRSQLCRCCDERRTCRPDPDYGISVWICRDCEQLA